MANEGKITVSLTVSGGIATEDATNYVQAGFSTGVYGMRLKAGMIAAFPAEPALSIKLKANTAACRVTIWHVGQ